MTAMLKNQGAMADFVTLIAPVSNNGDVIQSTTVYADRNPGGHQEFLSGKFVATAGAAVNSPSTISFPFKLQHSDATGSGWEDYTDPSTGAVPTITLTAASTEGEINVDLSNAKRYLRAYVDGAFTGGSSPELLIAAGIVLMGATKVPV